ncbi:cytochrome P450 CYP72A219-like [Phoenix dactylifera]|uniref:Cytochrome P450 CYP72A219-like n=1 Tax=Phoenix dactylifera TaxID=42345 RepID=A0A8B8J2A6_PHODC|nr:cytochrome P450 CYP72A219-like [Phoenix dactylifera]
MSAIWVGTTPGLVIWDLDLMKEILSNKSGHFRIPPPPNPYMKMLPQGVTILDGEKWAQHRSIINPAFHLEKLKAMIPAFLVSCTEMIKKWEMFIGDRVSYEIDVWPELQELTGDIISRTALGSNYIEGQRIFQLQREQIALILELSQMPYIPGFRFLPTKKNKHVKHLDVQIKALLRDLIKKKELAIRMRDCRIDDLLGLMLQSNCSDQQTHVNDSRFKGLTTEEVMEECKLFYFVGHESTSVLLTWTMVLLAMNPIWQDRAREEVLKILGRSAPNFESIGELKIINIILHEILRLYPSVPIQYRYTYRRSKIGGVSLPAGANLLLPTLLVNHDPEIWGTDAEEFKPQRFSRGVSNASKKQAAFFPFGWGPKACVGQNFALIEAKLALSMILQHFSFELSPTYIHSPYYLLTVQPQHGAQIILRKV